MTLSAEFSVEGVDDVTAHEVAYGATVDLALLSDSGVNVVTWTIQGTSHESFTAPAITPAGSPSGKIASFSMPADPGGGEGRSVLVKCTVQDSALNTAVAYRVIGVVNDVGVVPIAAGEENHRSLTHGWVEPVNTALAAVGGGGGSLTAPASPADNTKIAYAVSGDLDYADNIKVVNSGSSMTFGATVAASGDIRGGTSMKIVGLAGAADMDLIQASSSTVIVGDATDASILELKALSFHILELGGVDEYTFSPTALAMTSNNLTFTSGFIQLASTAAAAGNIRGGTSLSIVGLSGANDMDLIKASSGSVIVGETTHAANVELQAATSHIFDIAGTDVVVVSSADMELATAALLLGTGSIQQGAIVAGAGDFRAHTTWKLAARNNADSADVDLIQKTSADLVIIGDSTDASGVEFKTKTGTTFIFDVAGTDEMTLSATALDLSSNNLNTTGSLILGSGATSASSGRIRFSDNDTVTVYDGSTRQMLSIASAVMTVGSASTFTRYNSFDVHQFQINNTGRFEVAPTYLRHDASAAATWSLLSTATTGTGFALTIKGEDKTGSGAGTHTAGAVTLRAGDATGAGQTHVGGALTIQGGDATGGSGTRTGGNLVLRAGTGATANGELQLSDSSTPRIRINSTGLAFYNTAPVAKPTVSGAKGSNAALGSLMTALSNLGLVTDSTSA